MSELEIANIPLIGEMLENREIRLDLNRRKTVAAWAMKTAMVLESITAQHRKLFYTTTERHLLRTRAAIPELTSIWIGKYEQSSIGAWGTDLWNQVENIPPLIHSYITTIVVGHLAIQLLTSRIPPQYRDRPVPIPLKDGPWESLLVLIWPIQGTIEWPPSLAFSGLESLHISSLHSRWKTGITI